MPTSKQFGDACEMLVAAHLTLAGLPATIMPDGWPDYDVIVQPPKGLPQRISVKGRSLSPRSGATHTFHFFPDGYEWIAFVFLPEAEPARIWIVPADVVRESSLTDGDGLRLSLALLETKFAAWKDNFTLQREPPEAQRASIPLP
jgi:hypothetical protein